MHLPSRRLFALAFCLLSGQLAAGCGGQAQSPSAPHAPATSNSTAPAKATTPAAGATTPTTAVALPSTLAEWVTLFAEAPRPVTAPANTAPVDDRVQIARSMLRAERFEDAELALRTILTAHPNDARTEFLLAVAIHKQKRYSDALEIFARVLRRKVPFPEIDTVSYFIGWNAYLTGNPELARAAFEEHARRAPNMADTWFGLGVIALDEDRLDDAERHFTKAIELQASQAGAEREVAKAMARLSDVWLRRGNLGEAERNLRMCLQLFPDHYEAWAKLARVADRQGRPEEASEARKQEQEAMRRVGRLPPQAPTITPP